MCDLIHILVTQNKEKKKERNLEYVNRSVWLQ